MVAASTAFSPSSTMTASLVESTGLPSAAIPVHEDGNNGNGDSSADGSGDDGGMVRSLSLWNYFTMGFGAIIGTVWVLLDEIVVFEGCEHAKYVVLMDPLDGSSNIDVNVSVGTIFSIYRRVTPVGTPVTEEDFLQPGSKQVAAGYVVYGSSTMLVYTTGCGVHAFTYDPSLGVFCLSQERMRFPEKGNTYSINEGNYIRFPNGVKKYIKFCQEEDKATQRPYTSRYIGSLVADFHRNLLKGGIYLYPSTASHPDGKLRLLYECNPMAFLAEQAGGKASDGKERILDIVPESLHQRRSFFVGNDHMVEDVERMIREFPDA